MSTFSLLQTLYSARALIEILFYAFHSNICILFSFSSAIYFRLVRISQFLNTYYAIWYLDKFAVPEHNPHPVPSANLGYYVC